MKKFLGISAAVLMLIDSSSAHRLDQKHKLMNQIRVQSRSQGLFDKMIELATAEDKVAEERH